MELLKRRILEDGTIENGNILKVDNFLNHQLDIDLLNKIGKEFKKRFSKQRIDKILTIETSGIAIAAITAQYFKVPVVFARKIESKNIDKDTYDSEVFSYTKGRTYTIRISKKYINEGERILLIDDFLAKGKALEGLIDLTNQGRAIVEGIGIVIEKGFQEGGNNIRNQSYNLESLAIIKEFSNSKIIFD